jgi:hypothetical protein
MLVFGALLAFSGSSERSRERTKGESSNHYAAAVRALFSEMRSQSAGQKVIHVGLQCDFP